MVLESITSPHRRPQTAFTSSSVKKQFLPREELGSCATLLLRHRFLLTMMVILGFLCALYLYFAITLGAEACLGLTGAAETLCRLENAKASIMKGKLKFF